MNEPITIILSMLLGLVIGAFAAWAMFRVRAAATEARLDEARKGIDAQKETLASAEEKLSDTFKALSLDALKHNTEEFKKFSEQALKAQGELGAKELEGKKDLIDQSIESMTRKLTEMQKKFEGQGMNSMEKMTEVSELIRNHSDITGKLNETTDGLRMTLASSKKRGEWGERMAEDIIRLVGLKEGINYEKQKQIEDSTGRPDYSFFLPGNLRINMDVKFPLENYDQFVNATNDQDRKRHKADLLRSVKTMINEIGTKRDYIDTSRNTVDYAIIFIPNEQVFAFVNEADTTLMDLSLKQKIILCSPFTLYAVLAVVRQSVENFNLEQTASAILQHLGTFYKQWNMYTESFKKLGDKLDLTRKEYDALATTRSNQLERPLKKIDEIRKQKAIDIDETLSLDD